MAAAGEVAREERWGRVPPVPIWLRSLPLRSPPLHRGAHRGHCELSMPRAGVAAPFGRPHTSPPGLMRLALLTGCVSVNTKQKGKAAKSWIRLPCLLISWPAAIAAATGHLT